jgi:glycine hydroxymethyltransferase
MLVDLSLKNITGKDAELALDEACINANRNTIPFDTQSPFVTSGLRLSTPDVTPRGFGVSEMEKVAGLIDQALVHRDSETNLHKVHEQVCELARAYPIYQEPLGGL